jgi:AraC family transcriptional regulator of adaptative response/methylated-DNA-[protein]-cysteine methyltransferase
MRPSEPADNRYGDVAIRYALSRSMLGWMLVACTDKGICYVAFGDECSTLEQALQRRFEKARVERDEPSLRKTVQAVEAALSGVGDSSEMPLDLRGTPFQLEVWKLLRTIPFGTIVTYSELARRMGRPRAARAVAGACAANPVAVIVPCHRVIRGDGGLGGYYWGIQRKRKLLQWEADTAHKLESMAGQLKPKEASA